MKKHIWLAASLIFLLGACNTNEVFEKELYKKVIAFVCSDDYNILEDKQELTGGENMTFVSVSCGGTGAVETDVKITITEDNAPLSAYNGGMFDVDTTKYAKLLPKSKYDIDDYHIIIPEGERSGKLNIKIRPDGLSPDSVYFIPLSISALSAYEVNPTKSSMLYQVLIKNFYAEQITSSYTYYTMRGFFNGSVAQGTKPVQPLTKNKVRMMAGSITFKSEAETFDQYAVTLEVGADNKVTVASYKDLVVQQEEDPDFPNIFRIETDDWGGKYKVFLIAYSYEANGETVQMREELRLQYKED